MWKQLWADVMTLIAVSWRKRCTKHQTFEQNAMPTRGYHVGVGVWCGSLLVLMLYQSAMALTIGDLQIDNAVVAFGEQAIPYYAQSFVAPEGTLDEVTVLLASSSGPGGTHFRVLITETTGGTGAGIVPTTVLFESPSLTLPFDPSYPVNRLEFTAVAVPLGALLLNPGLTYALILDAFVEYDGVPGSAGFAQNNAYSEGHYFYYSGFHLLPTPNPRRADHFADSAHWIDWNDEPSKDLAFEIVYTPFASAPHAAPEPGTLVLLGSGLAGLLGYGWRRRQRVA